MRLIRAGSLMPSCRIGRGGAALAVAAVALAGCARPALLPGLAGQTRPRSPGGSVDANAARDAALARDLETLGEEIESIVEGVADHVAGSEAPTAERKAALLWKAQTADWLGDAAARPPTLALLDTWAVCQRVLRYLRLGDGRDLFGAEQHQAIEAAGRCERLVERLAQKHLPTEHLSVVRKEVEAHAADTPITGLWQQSEPASIASSDPALEAIGAILTAPLAPFASVGRLGEGVQNIGAEARRFTGVIADLPRETRWQMEMLMLAADETPSVKEALAGFDRLSRSSEAFARLAGNLPDATRGVLGAVDENRSVNAALESLESISAAADRAVTVADELPERTRVQAEQLLKTAVSDPDVKEALASIDRVSAAADEIAAVARRWPADVEAGVGRSVTGASEASRALVDHAAWRIAQLLILAALLGAGLMILRRALRPAAGPGFLADAGRSKPARASAAAGRLSGVGGKIRSNADQACESPADPAGASQSPEA